MLKWRDRNMSAVQRLIDGFLEFRETSLERSPDYFEALAAVQQPSVMCIACCDSRVGPSLLTRAPAGEIFVVRNIANLVPPFAEAQTRHGTSAALQYAVQHLRVENIIVLGHSQCGGIRGLLEMDLSDREGPLYVKHWVRQAEPAKTRTLAALGDRPIEEQARFCEQESIKQSLANLVTYPWVHDAVGTGALTLHGWYFDIRACALHRFDRAADTFVQCAPAPGAG